MIELRMPTADELRLAYARDLAEAFPPQELKPLSHIVRMTEPGRYHPLCLFDDGELTGECFFWPGNPGWLLLDYLCVADSRRNAGLGARLIAMARARYPDDVILIESEAPEHAPDPVLAARRLGFYQRNGAYLAGVDTEIFGVHYKTLYWANAPRTDEEIWHEHAALYRSSFPPGKYERYIKIPRDPAAREPSPVPWE